MAGEGWIRFEGYEGRLDPQYAGKYTPQACDTRSLSARAPGTLCVSRANLLEVSFGSVSTPS